MHLRKDNLSIYVQLIPSEDRRQPAIYDFRHLWSLPNPYFEKGWAVVREYWIAAGCEAFIKKFQENHIDKANGWRVALFAIGLPSHNNSLESHNNRFKLNLTKDLCQGSRRKPSLMVFLSGLFQLISKWSNKVQHKDFDVLPEISLSLENEGSSFAADPKLLELREGLYFCRQKTKGVCYILPPSMRPESPFTFSRSKTPGPTGNLDLQPLAILLLSRRAFHVLCLPKRVFVTIVLEFASRWASQWSVLRRIILFGTYR